MVALGTSLSIRLFFQSFSEAFVQANFRSQSLFHLSFDTFALFSKGYQCSIGFFLDDLYFANTSDINPLSLSNLIKVVSEPSHM